MAAAAEALGWNWLNFAKWRGGAVGADHQAPRLANAAATSSCMLAFMKTHPLCIQCYELQLGESAAEGIGKSAGRCCLGPPAPSGGSCITNNCTTYIHIPPTSHPQIVSQALCACPLHRQSSGSCPSIRCSSHGALAARGNVVVVVWLLLRCDALPPPPPPPAAAISQASLPRPQQQTTAAAVRQTAP